MLSASNPSPPRCIVLKGFYKWRLVSSLGLRVTLLSMKTGGDGGPQSKV